jgi:hypothetical protein
MGRPTWNERACEDDCSIAIGAVWLKLAFLPDSASTGTGTESPNSAVRGMVTPTWSTPAEPASGRTKSAGTGMSPIFTNSELASMLAGKPVMWIESESPGWAGWLG